jgi:hypothetical protein
MQVGHCSAARAERPLAWRAYQEGRESTGNGESQEIDRLSDPSATDEERQRRKRRLLKGAERVPRYSRQPS